MINCNPNDVMAVNPKIMEVQCERRSLMTAMTAADEMLEKTQFSEYRLEHEFRRMVRARYDYLTLKTGKDSVSYPANWIEAFKDRFFKGWLRRKLPVRMTTVTLKTTVIAHDTLPKNLGPFITLYEVERS